MSVEVFVSVAMSPVIQGQKVHSARDFDGSEVDWPCFGDPGPDGWNSVSWECFAGICVT